MKVIALTLLLITGASICAVASAVDTSDLDHLINMELKLHGQLQSNTSVNLQELEGAFVKKCYANDAVENVKQMQRELGIIEDRMECLRRYCKADDFCAATDQIKASVYNFANYAKDCLPSKNIKQANVLNRVVEVFDEFFCFKDGDRFLIFLAENGDDCLKSNAKLLRQCSKESFGIDFNATTDFARLLYFFMAENKCIVMNKFWSCIELRKQSNCKSTAVRILSDVFDNTKSAASCNKTKQSKRDAATEDGAKLYSFFRNRCNEAMFQRFMEGVGELYNCLQIGYQRAHSIADPAMFCMQDKQDLKKCFYDSIEKMSSCFRYEERFLKDFLIESLKSLLKFVCDDDAKHLRGYFSETAKVCSKRIVEASEKENELASCLNRIFSPHGQRLTKAELCRDLDVAEECTARYIGRVCPRNNLYQHLSKGFIQSLQAPCGCAAIACWSFSILVFVCFVIRRVL